MNPLDKLLEARHTLLTSVQGVEQAVVATINDYEERLAAVPDEPSGIPGLYFPKGEAGWGDTIRWRKETEQLLENATVISSGRSGIMQDNKQTSKVAVKLRDVSVIPGPHPTAWGIRLYSAELTCKRLNVSRMGYRNPDDPPQDGHPLYVNGAGFVDIRSSSFFQNGGNVQIVARDHESYVSEDLAVIVTDTLFDGNSWNPVGGGGGGAAQLALYCGSTTGTHVYLENSAFIHGDLPEISGAAHRGQIVVDPLNGGFFKALVLDGCTIYGKPGADRSSIQVSGTEEAVLVNTYCSGFQKPIDFDPDHALRDVRLKSLRVSGNRGTAVPIRVRGKTVGTTADELHLSF